MACEGLRNQLKAKHSFIHLKILLVNVHSFSIHVFIEHVHNTEETAARIVFGLVLMEFLIQ